MDLEVTGSRPVFHPQYMWDAAVVAGKPHKLEVGGSIPPPATMNMCECPSGLRGRSAKPVCVGSNPTSHSIAKASA